MATNKYIPEKLKIKDYRGKSGGYYEAICEVCGTLYYPKKSDSKYCNSNCTIIAYRKKVAEGIVKKEKSTNPNKLPNTPVKTEENKEKLRDTLINMGKNREKLPNTPVKTDEHRLLNRLLGKNKAGKDEQHG